MISAFKKKKIFFPFWDNKRKNQNSNKQFQEVLVETINFSSLYMAQGDFEWKPIHFGLWSKVSTTSNEGRWSPGRECVWGKSAQGYLFQQSGLFIDGESLAAAIPMLPALAAAMWRMVQFPKRCLLFSPPGKHTGGWEKKWDREQTKSSLCLIHRALLCQETCVRCFLLSLLPSASLASSAVLLRIALPSISNEAVTASPSTLLAPSKMLNVSLDPQPPQLPIKVSILFPSLSFSPSLY